MSKTPAGELSQAELDAEMQDLDERGLSDSTRFEQLWAEAEKRGLL